MISLYAACLRHLGLSQDEAGVIHARYGKAVRPDTIKSWAAGRNDPPLGAYEDLRRFAGHIRATMEQAPLAPADALFLAENVSPSKADDLGMPGTNALLVAIAGRMLG